MSFFQRLSTLRLFRENRRVRLELEEPQSRGAMVLRQNPWNLKQPISGTRNY